MLRRLRLVPARHDRLGALRAELEELRLRVDGLVGRVGEDKVVSLSWGRAGFVSLLGFWEVGD